MCIGALFGGGRKQQQPIQRQTVAPTMKAAAPPAEMVSPEKIKDEQGDEDKLSTKKKKAKGIITFSARARSFSSPIRAPPTRPLFKIPLNPKYKWINRSIQIRILIFFMELRTLVARKYIMNVTSII